MKARTSVGWVRDWEGGFCVLGNGITTGRAAQHPYNSLVHRSMAGNYCNFIRKPSFLLIPFSYSLSFLRPLSLRFPPLFLGNLGTFLFPCIFENFPYTVAPSRPHPFPPPRSLQVERCFAAQDIYGEFYGNPWSPFHHILKFLPPTTSVCHDFYNLISLFEIAVN